MRHHILFIVLIILVVFAPSLKNDFAWDDNYLIVDNPLIKDWKNLPDIFSTHLYEGDGLHSNFYRPIQLLSFMIDYSVWKVNPFGYHLTSLLLHIFNAILIYMVIIALGGGSTAAFLGGLFFGIAPSVSGIVYYIPARSDLLMGVFVFLSFLFFIRHQANRKLYLRVLSLICFAISLYCKEMSLGVFFVISFWVLRSSKTVREKLRELFPYSLTLFLYIFLRMSVLNFSKGPNPLIDFGYPASIPIWHRMLTDFGIILKYLTLLVFPYGLHMDWFIEPAKGIFQKEVIFSIIMLSLIVLVIKRLSRVNKLVSFGALWFILTLLPVLNIYPISVFFGEGWLYIPSVGFFIILAIIITDILIPRTSVKVSWALISFLVIYYSIFTFSYGRVWANSVNIFENIIKYEKNSPFIYLTHNNISMSYYDKGNLDKSAYHSEESIRLKPVYQYPYNNLGVVHMSRGDLVKAIVNFKKAINLKKDYLSAYQNLAYAYRDIGLIDRSIEFLDRAIKIDPSCVKLYCVLADMLLEKGDEEKAIWYFKEAKKMNSNNHEPYYYLGSYYSRNGKNKQAIYEYNRAEELGLRSFEFFNEKAMLHIKVKDYYSASKAFKNSLNVNPEQPGVHNNLGNIYSMYGEHKTAIRAYKKALELDPNNKGIINNIAKTELERNNAR